MGINLFKEEEAWGGEKSECLGEARAWGRRRGSCHRSPVCVVTHGPISLASGPSAELSLKWSQTLTSTSGEGANGVQAWAVLAALCGCIWGGQGGGMPSEAPKPALSWEPSHLQSPPPLYRVEGPVPPY